MREAEAHGTNPGSELMVEVFRKAGPSVILLDEVVAFARQLPDDRFEAFLSFIQSLTEAAKMAPNVLVVGSRPESDEEAGGPKGVAALHRLEKVFGRIGSPWLAAHGNETYEIVRRRLFQELDAEGEKARDETVKAFHELYRRNAAEFPPYARAPSYGELLRLSYPIHPELFERLSKDWSTLDKFQKTRGVLRFMANVVSVLWQARARDPMILPARIPISDMRIKASVIYPLDAAFSAVRPQEKSAPHGGILHSTRKISETAEWVVEVAVSCELVCASLPCIIREITGKLGTFELLGRRSDAFSLNNTGACRMIYPARYQGIMAGGAGTQGCNKTLGGIPRLPRIQNSRVGHDP